MLSDQVQPFGLATTIDKMATHTESRKDLVADRSRGSSKIVDAEPAADESSDVAAVHRAARQVGNIDANQIHRNTSGDRTGLSLNDRPAALPIVIGAGASQ